MGGNANGLGGTGSASPSGGKGPAGGSVQPYQGGQQVQQTGFGSDVNNFNGGQGGSLGLFDNGPATDPSPFTQQQNQQQNNGAFGLGQTAQSTQQQSVMGGGYDPQGRPVDGLGNIIERNPQQMGLQGIQGLMGGGYGKGGGGSMPNPYQPQQQGGMPMQQGGIEGSPSYDTFSNGMKGYTSPQMQQQMPQVRTMEARPEDSMPRQYQSSPSDPVLGFNPTQQSMQQGLPMQQLGQLNGLMDQPQTQQSNPYSGAEGTLQKAQQQVMQQAPQQNAITQMQAQMQQQAQQAPSKNMFYNMSAADIDKYNASHMKKGGRVK
jgi:hypothetical protein